MTTRHLTREQVEARWRWVPRAYLWCALLLVPWTIYLAFSLPGASVTEHYRLAWVGYDIWLAGVLTRVAWYAWHRDPKVVLVATVAASMLLIDAWFDVTTAEPGSPQVVALVSAFVFEIPGAILCAMLARRGLRVLVRRASIGVHPANRHREP